MFTMFFMTVSTLFLTMKISSKKIRKKLEKNHLFFLAYFLIFSMTKRFFIQYYKYIINIDKQY